MKYFGNILNIRVHRREYFEYQSPSFLTKELFRSKNEKLVSNIDNLLIKLINAINKRYKDTQCC